MCVCVCVYACMCSGMHVTDVCMNACVRVCMQVCVICVVSTDTEMLCAVRDYRGNYKIIKCGE